MQAALEQGVDERADRLGAKAPTLSVGSQGVADHGQHAGPVQADRDVPDELALVIDRRSGPTRRARGPVTADCSATKAAPSAADRGSGQSW